MDTFGYVLFHHATLDESGGQIVLRGALDHSSLKHVLVGDYQREVLVGSTQLRLVRAAKKGERLPSIELGVRGADYQDLGGGRFLLKDPTYVVDGLQRMRATQEALRHLGENNTVPTLGAVAYFGTTPEWEQERFGILNTTATRVGRNVLIRNAASEDHAGVTVLLNLSRDTAFVLYDRVCWDQRMKGREYMQASTFMKVAVRLHSHVIPGGHSNHAANMPAYLDRVVATIGLETFTANMRTFFTLVDTCFDLRNLGFRTQEPHAKATFLLALACILSDHENYWDGQRRLTVLPTYSKSLSTFPLGNAEMRRLASSAGSAGSILYELLLKHLNKGRTTGILRKWGTSPTPPIVTE